MFNTVYMFIIISQNVKPSKNPNYKIIFHSENSFHISRLFQNHPTIASKYAKKNGCFRTPKS